MSYLQLNDIESLFLTDKTSSGFNLCHHKNCLPSTLNTSVWAM